MILLFFAGSKTQAQVYNYLPIHHFAPETNPSVLSYEREAPFARFSQTGVPFSDGFSYTHLSLTGYSQKLFTGFGAVAGNTRYNDTLSYQHVGAGLAYRNIFFNKIYVKVGALYKFINVNAPYGRFDYYTFESSNLNTENRKLQNLNYSVSISSPSDFYYASYAVLNATLVDDPLNISPFPSYHVINVGNFANMFRHRKHSDIAFTALRKSHPSNAFITPRWSYYGLYYRSQILTRKTSLIYGSRIGYADDSYFHFTPSARLLYAPRYGGKKKYQAVLSIDLGYDKKTLNRTFDPQLQLQLIAEF